MRTTEQKLRNIIKNVITENYNDQIVIGDIVRVEHVDPPYTGDRQDWGGCLGQVVEINSDNTCTIRAHDHDRLGYLEDLLKQPMSSKYITKDLEKNNFEYEDTNSQVYIDKAFDTDEDYIFHTEMINNNKHSDDEDFLKIKRLYNQEDGDYYEFIFAYTNYLRKKDGLSELTKTEFYTELNKYESVHRDKIKAKKSNKLLKTLSKFNLYFNTEKLEKKDSNFYIYCASVGVMVQDAKYDRMKFIAGFSSSETPWQRAAPIIYQIATDSLDSDFVIDSSRFKEYNWSKEDWAFVFNYLTIYWNVLRLEYHLNKISDEKFFEKYNLSKEDAKDLFKDFNTIEKIISKIGEENLPISS